MFSKSANFGSVQQLLNDVAAEIVVEQLEKICYEKVQSADGVKTFVKINDTEHKDEYI